MLASCHYCRADVDPDAPFTWRAVIGWERKAASGGSRKGGSDVTLRQPRDHFACDTCITRLKRGVSPTQGTLA